MKVCFVFAPRTELFCLREPPINNNNYCHGRTFKTQGNSSGQVYSPTKTHQHQHQELYHSLECIMFHLPIQTDGWASTCCTINQFYGLVNNYGDRAQTQVIARDRSGSSPSLAWPLDHFPTRGSLTLDVCCFAPENRDEQNIESSHYFFISIDSHPRSLDI